MFLYTTPLHVVRSIIAPHVVSKYGGFVVLCSCRYKTEVEERTEYREGVSKEEKRGQ